ncbi:hypothetical protein D9757_007425 [Collybiopsis confluens]|uniref:F-box domain-containing protein n=1 Tax=Collybiopsis confluens TaxID=2823264 RepID=A0A8H5M7U8_9AGAR|nr:hypothetical protein D9757_007425 [Collybiopsis confluens]
MYSSSCSEDSSSSSMLQRETPIMSLGADSYTIPPLPSSMAYLLRTNEAPVNANLLQIHRIEAESTLSVLDQQLDEINAKVVAFSAKRDEIVSSIQFYRDVLHPIRRVPPDVLLEIFFYCMESFDIADPDSCRKVHSLNPKQGPWYLGQVCQCWRRIVLGCARLWSSISIDIDALSRYASEQPDPVMVQKIESNAIVLLSHHLNRSKDYPLRISVYSSTIAHPLLSLLCAHSFHWSSVLLSLHPKSFQMLTSIRGSLPKLEYLHVRGSPMSWVTPDVWSTLPAIDVFEYAPMLTTFRAHDIPNSATTIVLPWNQITKYSNGGLSTTQEAGNCANIDILTKGGKIRVAHLACRNKIGTVPIIPIAHEHLTNLRVELARWSDHELIVQLLDALTLPQIREIRLSSNQQGYDVWPIVRLLQRSRGTLLKLNLSGFDTDVDDSQVLGSPFRALLETVNDSLLALRLDQFPASLLCALSAEGNRPPPLPRLEEMRMSGKSMSAPNQNLTVCMLKSRVEHSSCKSSLVKRSSFPLTDETAKARMDNLVKEVEQETELGKPTVRREEAALWTSRSPGDSLHSSSISRVETSSLYTSVMSFDILDAQAYSIPPLPSSVVGLLKTNEAPVFTDSVESHRLEAESVLTILDQDLEKMKTKVSEFTAKREEIISNIQSCRDVLHPIRRTPPDILLEIFSYCIDSVDAEHFEACREIDSLDTTKAPWCLSQVCRYWRKVVLNRPTLWTSISIDIDAILRHVKAQPNPIAAQKIEADAIVLLSLRLTRSKDCPLKIALFSSVVTHPLISMICACSIRWSSALLSLHIQSFQMLNFIKGALPRLEFLHVRSSIAAFEAVWPGLPAVEAFENAPNLTSFRTYDIPNLPAAILLPWSQIKHVTNGTQTRAIITPEGNQANAEILTKARKLRTAQLACKSITTGVAIAPITHEHLVVLTLDITRRSEPDLFVQLLDALTLPKIQNLRLYSFSTHLHDVRPIVRLLDRSGSKLSRLRLRGFNTSIDDADLDGQALRSPFRALLGIVNETLLSLCLDDLHSSLLSALVVKKDQPTLLPRLHEIRMKGKVLSVDLQNLAVSMIESRVKCTKCKSSLVRRTSIPLTDEVAKRRMDALVKMV